MSPLTAEGAALIAVVSGVALAISIACWRSAWRAHAAVLRLTIATTIPDPGTSTWVPSRPCLGWIDSDRHDPHIHRLNDRDRPTTAWCPGWPPRPTTYPEVRA